MVNVNNLIVTWKENKNKNKNKIEYENKKKQ